MKNKQLAIHELLTSLPKPIVKHIQHLELMRQDFVANVSHELRTPLTVIHGYLESLSDQKPREIKPWNKIIQQMQQQTMRMETLIDDLLFLSRLESQNDQQVDDDIVNVNELLAIICQEAKKLRSNLRHKIKMTSNKLLSIKGNEVELRSLFSNIIFNAVKYTPRNGNINVEWVTKNGHAIFKVSDSGIGIAKEHIPRLTERFYRVDPARSRASGGTGLGLAIAKHVLLRHDGVLDIQSTLGKGSTFTCIFSKIRTII